jgi:hypothetical protein
MVAGEAPSALRIAINVSNSEDTLCKGVSRTNGNDIAISPLLFAERERRSKYHKIKITSLTVS